MELFCLDSLLPYEFYRKGFSKENESEKRLMLAVLEEAVHCFQKYLFAPKNSKNEYEFRNAEKWILEEDSEWLFSFNNICEVFELNPNYLRQGILRWKEKQLSGGRRKIA